MPNHFGKGQKYRNNQASSGLPRAAGPHAAIATIADVGRNSRSAMRSREANGSFNRLYFFRWLAGA